MKAEPKQADEAETIVSGPREIVVSHTIEIEPVPEEHQRKY